MAYPGRTLPFAVEHGPSGEAPPPHVVRLSGNRIILGGSGVSPAGIPFAGDTPAWENEDLFAKLATLNARGFPVAYQPKEMEGPDALMAWWQETGRLAVSFREIAWTAPDRWQITTIEPPEIGVLGWTGPKPFGH